MKTNLKTSFIKLIGASDQQGDIHDKIIIIPEVQRDFAFGRTDKKSTEKRIGFIDSIFKALESNKELPMTFVYGALDDDRFSPLDGQQRLSILFLLHWYFCPKDQIGIFKKDDQPRFVYEVRQFAKDFCRRIVDHSACDILDKENDVKSFFEVKIDASSLPDKKKEDQKKNLKIKLSDIIKNENWFIDSWTSDPTVSGMLVFLDAIHEKAIKDSTNKDEVWKKLISPNPPIYFDILVLDELTKPNELYVKMNSRGRELSEFDNFKSMMEGELQAIKPDKFDGNDISEKENKVDFIKNWTADIDNVWINVFWRYFVDKDKINEAEMKDMKNMKDPKFLKGIVGKVEDYYLKFFGLIMQFYIITHDDQTLKLNYTEITEESINDLSSLKRYAGKKNILNLIYQLKRAGFFTFDFFKYFRNCADALFYKDGSEDHEGTDLSQKTKNKDSLLKKILKSTSPTYVDRVMFFGLLCFLRMKSNASQVFITPDEFGEWDRVVYNLCNNSKIDDYNPYYNALIGVEKLCREVYDSSQSKDILSFLDQKTDTSDLSGFSERSIKEEIKKAKLIKHDEIAWKKRIKDAENDPLFDGYISALFECKEFGVSEDQSKFDDRLKNAKKFFIKDDKKLFVKVLSYLISNMNSGQANACLRVQKQKQVFYPSSSVLNTILTDDDWYSVVHGLLDSGAYSKLVNGGSERWHGLLSDEKLLEYVIDHDRASAFYVNGDFLYPKSNSSFYIALDAQRRDEILADLLNNTAISLKDGYKKIDLSNSSSLFIGPISIEFVYKNCTFRWKFEGNKLAKLDNRGNEIEVYEIQSSDDSKSIKLQMDNMLAAPAAPAATASPTTAAPGPTSTKSSTTKK